ncbi:DUF6230 family protein [Sphaerisporangium sp. NBC_01403]|uniref:DUF6230 family protein n=1 Tax=Sphaerisporangium sp. NBC_01403 TaxID=2903599 RepID=UPI0032547167
MREQGRVRWKRFALIFIPAAAVASVLVGAVARGAVGASFVVAGEKIKVTADLIRAWDVAEFPGVVETKGGKQIPVYLTMNRHLEAFNLCQSYLVDTPMGTVTIKVTGGTGKDPVTADNQVIYARRLAGDNYSTNVQIGRDASTASTLPGITGQPGVAGQVSSTVVVKNSRQIILGTSAERLGFPESLLRVLPGIQECF